MRSVSNRSAKAPLRGSVARIVRGKTPAAAGMPAIVPASASDSPAGKEPSVIVHVNVPPLPPAACREAE